MRGLSNVCGSALSLCREQETFEVKKDIECGLYIHGRCIQHVSN